MFRRFMQGRYGNDQLNKLLIWGSLAVFLVGLLIPPSRIKMVLILLYYVLLGYALFRMLSRSTYRRYLENRRYLRLLERVRDRSHKYYDCPRCRQPVRVPRGKGKIAITCPKCKERFIRKT